MYGKRLAKLRSLFLRFHRLHSAARRVEQSKCNSSPVVAHK